jgi:hypothetical protein
VSIPANIYLSGGPNDYWVFQIAGTLDISSAQKVILEGGAEASNVFWLVAGQTTLETYSQFVGTILDQTAVVLQTGASLDGAVLAQSASTSDDNAITDSVVVPEPGTFLLLGAAVAGLLVSRRKVVRCAV